MRMDADARIGETLRPEEAIEPILAKPVRAALIEWLTEVWAEKELQEVGLLPRRRALFHGAPGVGKTTLAHHLAARLGLEMAVIRPDHIHGKYFGTGTSNVKYIFDQLEALDHPVVVFFDEMDTLAAKRMHSGINPTVEHDHNAMINTLLARLDAYSGFIIAATNRGDALDPAVWRRFEIQIELALPGQFERERILARYLCPFGLPKHDLRRLAEAFETATPALMRQFGEGLKRQLVVGPKCGWDMTREAVIDRLIASVGPHPDLGKPRLWSLGTADHAVTSLPWPLPMVADVNDDDAPVAANPVSRRGLRVVGDDA